MSGNVQWNGKFPIGPVRPEMWSSSKGGPHFPELFQLGRTVPLSFEPKFPEILVEWIAPNDFGSISIFKICKVLAFIGVTADRHVVQT